MVEAMKLALPSLVCVLPYKRKHQRKAGTGAMHLMVTIKVPVIVDCLKEAISSSMQYENGLSSRHQTCQQKSHARLRSEVPDTQDCKLPRKPLQCVEDDMTMSDTGGLSAHSDDTDGNYHASSEEDGSMKSPSKHHRLPTQPSGPASCCPWYQIQRAAATAGHEGVKWQDSRVQTMTVKDHSTTPWNIDHVAQVVFEMITGCPMTASDLAGEMTAAANTGRDYSEQKVEDVGGRRHHWTQEEEVRLVALKQDGFSWTEIKEQFPQRQLSSLRQRWYTKLQNMHGSNPPTNKQRQEWNCKRAHPIPVYSPSTKCVVVQQSVSLFQYLSCPRPLKLSHCYPSGQPQAADDRAMLNAKPRTPSPSSTVTTMCLVCNSVVEVEASSAFNTANNRMRVSDQLWFCTAPAIGVLCTRKCRSMAGKFSPGVSCTALATMALRGHEVLSAHVTSHFKDAVDSLTGINSVVLKYGTIVYAQEVLVPKLGWGGPGSRCQRGPPDSKGEQPDQEFA
ncbi:uncharacterized protein PADG_02697 [Paracoccidioides brasiliensis Pb18]|uniref:Myb-like domain-containing protein n=1 Tax=Paracoccidioides brasiliensis (strain Pb18) TaxID=502780 RepID=C1G692_PARBD|nr:uncharacterized protein PADG_02697 [Paracoccidioides brasiliensis Pb18]EEH46599.2 hypothetical protein PADG_02697 [Paracoccidioides brasiliensis Pb18]